MIPQLLQNCEPAIVRHKDVALDISYYDVDPWAMHPKVMTECYEAGMITVFKNAGLKMTDEQWALLNSVDIPPQTDNFVKKAKLKHLFRPLEKIDFNQHILSRMVKWGQARPLQDLMIQVTERIRGMVKLLFPDYKILDAESITWRLTPTESEPMHYDAYGDTPNDYHNVRVFVNLDSRPRLWAVSHKVTDVIPKYRDLMKPYSGEHPNLFNAALNKHLPWEEIPRTFISFAPLNMWLVNSQVVAHEIIYGRRMLAATIACDPKSMKRPELHFVNQVRNAWK